MQRGGDYGYYPLFYAISHDASSFVISYIISEMVETYGYPVEFRSNVKKGMIHSLYETTDCWKHTTIKHVQLIVEGRHRGVDTQKNRFGTLPLYFAIRCGAKLEVVIWLCEQTGIDVVKVGGAMDGMKLENMWMQHSSPSSLV